MLKSRHIADSYIYATHTLLICEIEDKEEGESSRNYMYISILHPFLCSSCKYFKQNKCVKLEKYTPLRADYSSLLIGNATLLGAASSCGRDEYYSLTILHNFSITISTRL